MIVREVLRGEMSAVGALRVEAYKAQDLLAVNPDYEDTLHALGADGHGMVFVAVEDDAREVAEAGSGQLLGTVMLEPWHPDSEVARGSDEAEVRALAVAPQAQRRGVGRALMQAVIEEATARGTRRLVLCTQPAMTGAQQLYQALGFIRDPERDWSPAPGHTLLAFALPLTDAD
jgi:ribosomal protein S18 acetylase RimI-like enzyme